MGLLQDKVAIITGASKGIGRVMSLRFAAEGASVVCAARSADLVKETAELVTKAGGRAIAVVSDASIEDEVKRLVETTVKTFGKIDVLINNAGDGGPTKPVQDYTMEDWRYTIDSCLTSSYLCIRFVVPEMIKRHAGSIVNVSSMAGRRGLEFRIGYCSSKAGQVGMAYGLAKELGPHGIRVNVVAPGLTLTDATVNQPKQMHDAIKAHTPLRRLGEPEDIAGAVLFLCSDEAKYVTGAYLPVCGGSQMT